MDKKNFDEILKEVNKKRSNEVPSEEILESFPLSDVADQEILMHREAHFGGSFDVMLEYYREEGKGIQPHFQLRRIEQLKAYEEAVGENIAPFLLSGADAEKIREVRETYENLRDIYEKGSGRDKAPRLIADLILTEEENPTEEVAAIVAEKNKIIPLLLDLIRSEKFHDPLFPGYGEAPYLAARCLGEIGDPRVIISLFNEIGEGDLDNENMVLRSLKTIGDPAKEFLLKVVQSTPIGTDNERAALALLEFEDDEAVAECFLSLLEKPEVQKDPVLATYAVLGCGALVKSSSREKFKSLIPKSLKRDGDAVIKSWAS